MTPAISPYAVEYLRKLSPQEKKALAQRCGIKRSHIYNFLSGGKRPSIALAAKMEVATRGQLPRRCLRPDVDWDLLAGTSILE